MKTVSVITTIYNAEKFLKASLHSVLSQIITDDELFIEYIIVNDCSTDNSILYIHDFLSKYQYNDHINVKILELETNRGCGAARKFGIDNATGDYLMFLDADDYYIHNDFVQRAVNTIENQQADIVEYGLVYNYSDGKKINSSVEHCTEINDPESALIALFKNNMIKFHIWTKIIRRNIIEQFPYSEARTFEDVITTPVWISLCHKIIVMPTIEINYRATQNSIIREKLIDTRLGTVKAIANNFERFKHWPKVLKAMYERAMIDLSATLNNSNSESEGFNEMSKWNTHMLSYIMPDDYEKFTYNIENDEK